MTEEEEKKELKELSVVPKLGYKSSFARLKSSGSMNRPIHRLASTEKDKGMTDKLHSLMASYLPKDMVSIERA
jgi:hypothetical protein